jgi:hypothetical protein
MEPLAPPTNPYAPPRAELDAPADAGLSPNLAAAVEGRYDFTVGDVMDEAWRLVKGMKATFWGAAVVVGLIYLVVDVVGGILVSRFVTAEPNVAVKQVFNSIEGAVMTPFTMGLQMMCVRRALGQPISFSTAFSYFPRAGTALAGAFLVLLVTGLGTLALIIPGIYLVIAYDLVTQLICDQNLSASDAMETSRKAITHRWWGVFGLGLVVALLTGLSALGLLIPLIWTLPWSMMTTAVLYRRMFYAASEPTAEGSPPIAA